MGQSCFGGTRIDLCNFRQVDLMLWLIGVCPCYGIYLETVPEMASLLHMREHNSLAIIPIMQVFFFNPTLIFVVIDPIT